MRTTQGGGVARIGLALAALAATLVLAACGSGIEGAGDGGTGSATR